MTDREIHLERLLGKKVLDAKGESAGHIEEVIAERQGDDWVIQEYWVGPAALIDRFSVQGIAKHLLTLFGVKRDHGYKLPWDKLDLTNLEKPRLRCTIQELEALTQPPRLED